MSHHKAASPYKKTASLGSSYMQVSIDVYLTMHSKTAQNLPGADNQPPAP